MSLSRLLRRLFSPGSEQTPQEKEPRYDNVEVENFADGTTIKGHEAVKAYFDREKELHDAYGSSIIFQVYRINLRANTIEGLQGERLAEIKVDGDFVAGNDAVAAVKSKVRPLLEQHVRAERKRGAPSGFDIVPEDRITLIFNGRPMTDDRLFYADHFMMLPAWVQVFLHSCEFGEVAARAAELRNQG